MHRFIFTLLLCLASFASAAAEPLSESGLKTSIYSLSFPEGWKLEKKAIPIPLRGPHGEMMLISAIMPDPNKQLPTSINDDDLRKFWREKIHDALTSVVSQEGMQITQRFKETQVNGMPYISVASRMAKKDAFLAGYGLVGTHGVVFIVTVEGWSKDESSARKAAENMLKSVRWDVK